MLVLGSLPSRRSVAAGEYYAHPRNAFWTIMGHLADAGPELAYRDRVARLRAAGIAVWDVLAASVRPGSMDADIDRASAVPNDFNRFFERHRRIGRVCFNGRTAADLYRRLVLPETGGRLASLDYLTLPSTSPAHAAIGLDAKVAAWRRALASPPQGV